MKYIKFLLLSKDTSSPVTDYKYDKQLVVPSIPGLVYEFKILNENTKIMYYYGSCSDETDTNTTGIVEVLTQAEYNLIKENCYKTFFDCPVTVTATQFRLQLLKQNLLDQVEQIVKTLSKELQIYWEYSTDINRTSNFIEQIANQLDLFQLDKDEIHSKIDKIFTEAEQI